MDVSVIIVNWNSREYLERCLASIVAHTRAVEYEIVVIDSGSFDGCDRMLREHYPHVRFIQGPTNVGFARANNRAFEESGGECVLFLNPDTELCGPAIETLHRSLLALPDAGVVGCRLLNADGTLQCSCVQSLPTILNQLLGSEWLISRSPRSRLWGRAALYEDRCGPREVQAVSGACLMVTRRVFEQVGRFSEAYFMYGEDIDLSHKCRRGGYRNYYVADAAVLHYGGSSSSQAASAFAAVMMRESIWRFFRQSRGQAYGFAYRVAMIGSAAARLSVLGLVWLTGTRTASRAASWRKWRAVLRWSLNRDGIVTQYYAR